MKLRKALDQAKMERQNGGSVSRVSNTVITKNSSSQWVSPGYDAPCASPLDRKVAEKNRGVCLNPNNKEVEQYRILKTRIAQVAKTNKMNSIMITSPNKGEGKTVTCINIGFTFARAMDQTALLVDCDFKGQDIHRYLGIANKESLIDYFLDNVPLKELIVWPGVDKLTLISGDRTVNESTELLSSDMMADLVNEMSSRYDDRMVFLIRRLF